MYRTAKQPFWSRVPAAVPPPDFARERGAGFQALIGRPGALESHATLGGWRSTSVYSVPSGYSCLTLLRLRDIPCPSRDALRAVQSDADTPKERFQRAQERE
jgi:hypothetical protein